MIQSEGGKVARASGGSLRTQVSGLSDKRSDEPVVLETLSYFAVQSYVGGEQCIAV
jgi:hypothetical protein